VSRQTDGPTDGGPQQVGRDQADPDQVHPDHVDQDEVDAGREGPAQGEPEGRHVGSVAEEAAKLLGAFSGWAREHGDGVSGSTEGRSEAADATHEHLAADARGCTWCPVCRAVDAFGLASPEVRAHLSSAASSLMLAVSAMMATAPPDREAGRDVGVEPIRLDEDWPEGSV
jgi:hypothetical protein